MKISARFASRQFRSSPAGQRLPEALRAAVRQRSRVTLMSEWPGSQASHPKAQMSGRRPWAGTTVLPDRSELTAVQVENRLELGVGAQFQSTSLDDV